ncbi:sulfatase family protein [Rubritalea sp.]|uniref:sulfatase family protein n=1 Tax=Rubritalea sp. TaxID=2109375 RepID=UPI003EF6CAF7
MIKLSPITKLLALSSLFSGQMAVSSAAEQQSPQPSHEKPNFIIIYTDDLGYGDLSCMGSKTIHSPNIDKMAAEGLKFLDFYSGSASCTPARAALMTGSYPPRVNLDNVLFPDSKDKHTGKTKGLNPSEITIAELLKSQGYATGMVGKWHLGDDPSFMPNNQGFDAYFGLPYSNDMVPPRFVDLPLLRNGEVLELNPDQDYITQRYTEESLAFIEKNKEQPFFLFLSHSMPHRACHASPEFTKRFTKEQLSQIKPGEDKKSRDFLYPAAVEEIDWSTGVILKKLAELGIEENTLIVFTSDNGPMTGSTGPLRGKKGGVHEGGHRVPAIMQWKGRIPAGSVTSEIATAMDLLPTFANLAGTQPPQDRVIDGHDILPLLESPQEVQSPYKAFFYTHGGKAVRSGKWKLILGRKNGLYDLSEDIGEKKNLAAQHPEIVQNLQGLFEGYTQSLKNHSRPAGSLDDSPLQPK